MRLVLLFFMTLTACSSEPRDLIGRTPKNEKVIVNLITKNCMLFSETDTLCARRHVKADSVVNRIAYRKGKIICAIAPDGTAVWGNKLPPK